MDYNTFKKCSVCEEYIHVTDFYKDSTTKDGLRSNCKKCFERKHRAKLLTNEIIRLEEKKDKDLKYLAHKKVQLAVLTGVLVKPMYCQLTGVRADNLHAHHEDYNKPLEVIWCTPQAHARLHAEKRKGVNNGNG